MHTNSFGANICKIVVLLGRITDSTWKSVSLWLEKRYVDTKEWFTFVQLWSLSKSYYFHLSHFWGKLTTKMNLGAAEAHALQNNWWKLCLVVNVWTSLNHTCSCYVLFITVPPLTAAERLFNTTSSDWVACFVLFWQILDVFFHLVAN